MSEIERIVDPVAAPIEGEEEATLRPKRLSEFVGQAQLKEHLDVMLSAAKGRGQAVDHLLFAGPPGLGKTTLAGIVANELDTALRVTSGPALERAGDLAAIVSNLDDGDILFVDEIHRMARTVEEVLYTAMEDFQLDLVIGKGPTAKTIRIDLPRFTLVGATTRTGLLSSPLRDRFGFVARLDFYSTQDLESILRRTATILGVTLESDAVGVIAERGRGTPRIANRLLRRVRDFAETRADGSITASVALDACTLFEVDALGLDKVDRLILKALVETFRGQPVGLTTVAAAIGEAPDTLEEVYEPFLLQQGLLLRTPRGRCATERAYRHIGVAFPSTTGRAETLFEQDPQDSE